jgi:hypothetical protein
MGKYRVVDKFSGATNVSNVIDALALQDLKSGITFIVHMNMGYINDEDVVKVYKTKSQLLTNLENL